LLCSENGLSSFDLGYGLLSPSVDVLIKRCKPATHAVLKECKIDFVSHKFSKFFKTQSDGSSTQGLPMITTLAGDP
jgi:hypothetical protein